jgi:hypothetical protein
MSRTQAVHITPDRITPRPSCRFTQHLAEKPCPPRRRQRLQVSDQVFREEAPLTEQGARLPPPVGV